MNSTMPIGWGIIGGGDVVMRKSGPALLKCKQSSIIGVFCRNSKQATHVTEMLGGRVYETYEQMLEDPQVDIVYVATPHYLHYEHTLQALRARKHVLCEKPIAVSVSQARDMIQAADDYGVELFIAYYRRFHPIVQMARTCIDNFEIGEITFVEYRSTFPLDWSKLPGPAWMWDCDKAGGGAIVNIGVHRLDILHYLVGSASQVIAQVDNFHKNKPEKWICGMFQYTSGACGIIVQHSNTCPPCDILAIHGRCGMIKFDPFDKCLLIQVGKEIRKQNFVMPSSPHKALLEHIVSVLKGQVKNETVSGREAFYTTELVSALYTSASQEHPVKLTYV